jgi:NAD+ diphosphatase
MFQPRVSLPEHFAVTDGRWFVLDERNQLLLVAGSIPTGPEPPTGETARHLLGIADGRPVWTIVAPRYADVGEDGEWVDLRSLYGRLEEADWVLAGRAVQVVAWDRDHKFCSRCGTEAQDHPMDRAKQCPRCRLVSYPRLTPAIITLVERDDGRALLAWGRQFPGRFYSALAGFVEPGESLEECVQREVREEVGIEVTDIRYFGSQPWPFPHSLMVGFQARWASGEIQIDDDEIVEAAWYGPDELPPVPRGGMSIAGWLIEDWLRRSANASRPA